MIGRGGGIRTRDPLHPMQVRYQAALRPEGRDYIRAALLAMEKFADRLDFHPDAGDVHALHVLAVSVAVRPRMRAWKALVLVKPVACAVDREALFI